MTPMTRSLQRNLPPLHGSGHSSSEQWRRYWKRSLLPISRFHFHCIRFQAYWRGQRPQPKKPSKGKKKMGSPDEHQPTNSGDITPRVRRGRCLLTTVGRKIMLYVGFYPNFEDYPAPNGGLAAWRDLWSTYLRWLSSQFRNSSVGPFIHPPTKEEAKVSDGDQGKARDRTNYMLPKCVWPEGFPCYWILPELHRQPARILKLGTASVEGML